MKLSEIIDVFIAGDWGNESPSLEAPHAVSCVRGADIVPISNNEFANIPLRYVSEHSFQQKLLQVGDIVIEKSGGSPTQSTGRAVYISQALLSASKDVVCSNFCVAFRVKEGWNSFFIYQYWQYLYNSGVFFNFEGKTSGIKNLQLDIALSAIEIEPYPIKKQISIANCLETFDEKITLNRALNHNLEALAKQLYDYWFVQFDFPDENGKPYKSSGGKMAWNEKLKRDIPSSWAVKTIDDVVEVYNGATPSTADEENYGGDVVWITPKDLSNQQQKFIYQGERNISNKGYESCSTHLLPSNTVLMSSRAPIGLLAIAKTELSTNQGFKSFVPKNDNEATYLYYYIQAHIKQIEQLGTGTTFKEVSREDVLKFPILKPNDELLDTWEERISAINDKQLEIQKENENLTKQRDELLPLLMNNQVSLNYDLSAFNSVFSQTILSIARLAVAV